MNPQHIEYLRLISYTYLQHRKFDRALVYLRVIKRLLVDDVQNLLSLTYAYMGMGSYQSALRELERALTLPDISEEDMYIGYLLKGRVLWELNQQKEAKAFIATKIKAKQS